MRSEEGTREVIDGANFMARWFSDLFYSNRYGFIISLGSLLMEVHAARFGSY